MTFGFYSYSPHTLFYFLFRCLRISPEDRERILENYKKWDPEMKNEKIPLHIALGLPEDYLGPWPYKTKEEREGRPRHFEALFNMVLLILFNQYVKTIVKIPDIEIYRKRNMKYIEKKQSFKILS